jgi:uncharacterized membrane protein YdcZ (DUF606 family)
MTDKVATLTKMGVGCLGLAGACILLYSTSSYGIGISADGAAYITIARNLMHGKGFVDFDGFPSVSWPPLYPLTLAFGSWLFHVELVEFARAANALYFGLAVCASGLLLVRFLTASPVVALLGAALPVVGPRLFSVFAVAQSEGLFIALASLFILLLYDYKQKPTGSRLALLSLVSALACLTRYTGTSFAVCGFVVIVLTAHESKRIKVRHLVSFLIATFTPICIWLSRNWLMTRDLTGGRHPSSDTPVEVLDRFWGVLTEYFLPETPFSKELVSFLMLGVMVSLIVSWLYRKSPFKQIQLKELLPLTVFLAGYCGVMFCLALIVAFDELGFRLLSPVLLPANVLVFSLLGHSVKAPENTRLEKALGVFLALGILTILTLQAWETHGLVSSYVMKGVPGYNDRGWKEGEIIQRLKSLTIPSGAVVYSNNPQVVSYLLQSEALFVPWRLQYRSSAPPANVGTLRGRWPAKPEAYLIWFYEKDEPWWFSPAELDSVASLHQIVDCREGQIYRVVNDEAMPP